MTTWMRDMAVVLRGLPFRSEAYVVANIRSVAEIFPAGESYLRAHPHWPMGVW